MWVLLSLLCALSWATSDFFSKRALAQGHGDELGLAWFRYVVAVPLVALLFLRGVPQIAPVFWPLHLLWIPLELLAIYLYLRR